MAFVCDIPARAGKAARVKAGGAIRLINTLGSQVVDTWAFNAADTSEFMSMEHTRVMLGRVSPRKGDKLFSNRRRPMLVLEEDTSPGVHDTLRAACDPERYRLLGFSSHASCAENLTTALAELGLTAPHNPCPLNMFENCPVGEDGALIVVPPPVTAGQYVVLRALIDTVVVFSSCPMDVFPTNGPDCTPKPIAYEILETPA
ncbi:MAG: urea carboxylase-associated family protein [Alphaproteobacteria bacterium]|nr:urea carboxylase-associated family protein [Alphaproteobacteria bacterium]